MPKFWKQREDKRNIYICIDTHTYKVYILCDCVCIYIYYMIIYVIICIYHVYVIHGICMAPHTPSTEAIEVPVGSANGIQGARHILLYCCMHDLQKQKQKHAILNPKGKQKKKKENPSNNKLFFCIRKSSHACVCQALQFPYI